MATTEERFAARLAQLRAAKGASARDMSLSIGQSAGYINNIENKKSFPSMAAFFCICEYLGVTPQEFFDFDNPHPRQLREILACLEKLDAASRTHVEALLKGLIKS